MKKFLLKLLLIVLFTANGQKLLSEKYIQDSKLPTLAGPSFDFETSIDESERENYEVTVDFIKEHEGYANGYAYRCVSGKLTIGYGHVIREGEEFPEQISVATADSLLRADMKSAYSSANKVYPELRGSKKMAITHFIFSKGIGSFLKSGLKKQIDANGDVDQEFEKWCYYTDCKTGNKVYSKVASRIQEWEKNMWHKDDLLYAKAAIQQQGR